MRSRSELWPGGPIRAIGMWCVLVVCLCLSAWAHAQSTITVSPTTVPASQLGAGYSVQLSAQGGVAPYTFRAIQGPMPPGLTISAAGLISGNTYQIGSYPFVVEVRSATGAIAAFAYTLQVDPTAGLGISPSSMPQGMAGIRYPLPVSAFGGVAPYAFQLTGTLPAGLSFDPATGFDGTPLAAGSFPLTLRATDASNATATRDFTLTIAPPTIELYPGALGAVLNEPFSQTIGHNGGLGPFHYAITAGTLPPGIGLDANTGTLSGTPTVAGRYAFDLTITDSTLGTPGTDTQRYELSVYDATIVLSPATLPTPIVGQPYSAQLSLSGSSGPTQFVVDTQTDPYGALPPGLTLSPSGLLSGTPNSAGTFRFTVLGTYDNGAFMRRNYELAAVPPTLTLTPSALPAGRVGVPYPQSSMRAQGGSGTYRYQFYWIYRLNMWVGGLLLPTGMRSVESVGADGSAVSSSGITLTGTPTTPGAYSIVVVATDTAWPYGVVQTTYSLQIDAAALTLGQPAGPLPIARPGSPYAQQFAASGGYAPYQYAISAGALPAGMSFDAATGTLSGTPAAVGDYAFSVTVTDSAPDTPTQTTAAYSLRVTTATLAIGPPTLPNAYVGASYLQTLTASGGTAPYRFSALAGLPQGIGLSTEGTLSGVPSTAGDFTFQVAVVDQQGLTGNATFALKVIGRPDPSRDPEVRGLLEAQSDATRRFATTQINNFDQRLQRLHNSGGQGGFDNGLSVNLQQYCPEIVGQIPNGRRCERANAGGGAGGPGTGESFAGNEAQGGSGEGAGFGIWASGMVRSGNHEGRSGSPDAEFETDGLSFGIDRSFSERFAAGAGVGYGRDTADVGENGSRNKGTAYTLALYGSYRPTKLFYIDGLLGYQSLDFDVRRYVTPTGGFVQGTRGGTQWFASLSVGADAHVGNWGVSPYVRADLAQATLDGYTEHGDPIFALHYEKMDVDTSTGNLGVRLDYRHRTGWGVFSPQLRMEFQHDFKGNGAQSMYYADLPALRYRAQLDDFDTTRWMFGLGLLFDLDSKWSIKLDYRALFGNNGDTDRGVQVNVDKKF